MARVSIKIDGAKEITQGLQDAMMLAEVEAEVAERTEAIYERSQAQVNVDTGRLKRSGSITYEDELSMGVKYETPYAKLVHDGWTHYEGNPYLKNPFLIEQEKFRNNLDAIFHGGGG